MIKQLTFLFAVWLCLPFTSIAQNQADSYWENKLFLKIKADSPVILPSFQNGQSSDRYPILETYIHEYDIQNITRPFPLLKSPIFEDTYLVELPEGESVDVLMQQLKQHPDIEYAEKVPLDKLCFDPNDPLENAGQQWYLNTINAYQAWDFGLGNANVVIAVIDDAVRITHEDLAPSLWVNTGEIPGNGIDDDGNGYVDDINGYDIADDDNNPNPPASATTTVFSHGTHVAGVAGAATHNSLGVASIGAGISIMAVKCTKNSASNPSIIQYGWAGVQYAIASGADIISISWGGTGSSITYQNMLNLARSQGILVVASAGNNGSSTAFYPAAYDNVIAVAATKDNDVKASYSNYGNWVTISAPGSGIKSTVASSDNAYANKSGTSMAAPLTAGLCALILSNNPTLTPAELENCLILSADDINADNPSYVGMLGAGRINAYSAVQCAAPTVVCNTPTSLNVDVLSSSTAVLTWNEITGVDSYLVRVKKADNITWNTYSVNEGIYIYSGMNACEDYEFQVKAQCGSQASDYTASAYFTSLPTNAGSYCTAKATDASDEWIANVNIAGLNIVSGSNNGYGQYLCEMVTVTAGESFAINLTPAFSSMQYSEYWKIWVDLNQDGDFTDSDEVLYDANGTSSSTVAATVSIPTTALEGTTRMRVAMKRITGADPIVPTSCLNFQYGEVEDYSVTILPALVNCAIPDDITVTNITTNSALLFWASTPDAGAYTIRYKATSASSWSIHTTASSIFSLESLTPSTNYEIQLRANCTGSNSDYSSSAYFNTASEACGVPINLSSSNITTNSATVSWNEVNGAELYNIRYRPLGTSSWANTSATTTSKTLNSLIAATGYEFEIRANCNTSSSNYSVTSTFTTEAAICDEPTGFTASNITETSVLLSWAVINDSESYTISYRKVGASSWLLTSANTNFKNLTGLENASAYEYKVKTNCSFNSSDYAAIETFSTLSPACNTPTSLNASAITTSSVQFSWVNVSGALGYTVRYKAANSSSWSVTTANSNSKTINDLAEGTAFELQVRSNCGTANSAYSPSLEFETENIACTAPSTLTATGATTSNIILNWSIVPTASAYTVRYRPTGSSNWTSAINVSTTKVLTGLAAGTNYEFQVKSDCGSGNVSAYSASQYFTTVALACLAPSELTSSMITSNSALLSWDAVAEATSYALRYRASGSTGWTSSTISGNSLSISDLQAASAYEFQVKTNCSNGSSDYSALRFFMTTESICTTPSNLNVLNITPSTATLSWTTIPGALNYIVRYKLTTASSWSSTIVSGTGIASKEIMGLEANSTYEFGVRTLCGTGSSPYSSSYTFATEAETLTCEIPSGLNAFDATPTTAIIQWNTVESAITYSLKYREQGTSSWSITSTSSGIKILSALTPATVYEIKVRTNCENSESSAYSSVKTFTTQTSTVSCNQPSALNTLSVTATQASLTWNASGEADGYAVSYKKTTATNWNNIESAFNSVTLSTLLSCTAYEFKVKSLCGDNESAFSSSYTFTTVGCEGSPVVYCTSQGGNANYEWIANVALGTLNNASGSNSGYGDYTSLSTELASGTTYPITLTPGFANSAYNEYWRVWIDFNQDGDFEDNGEMAYDAENSNKTEVTGALIVPSTATLGATRMRVVMKYNQAPEACQDFPYGETEDYTVEIVPAGSIPTPDVVVYCDMEGGNANYEWIETVSIGNLYHTSSSDGGYGNFTAETPTDLAMGTAYPIALTPGFAGSAYSEYWRIWIDYNQDGDFEDAHELAFDSGSTSKTTVNGTLILPAGIAVGNTRMRVAMKYNGAPTACQDFAYGEVEDYTVNITDEGASPSPEVVYCESVGGNANYEWIAHVKFGDIDHASASDGGYGNYTSISTDLDAGGNYIITLTPGFISSAYKEYWAVWIDYNQDGDFADDGELAFDPGYLSKTEVTGIVTIPEDAVNGNTRMRVAMRYNGVPNYCESFSYGEVEDYSVFIVGGNETQSFDTEELTDTSPTIELAGECNLVIAFEYAVEDLKVGFENLSKGNIKSYLWDFGDGKTSTETHPVHLYSTEGMYKFTLTATNDAGCTQEYEGEVYVFEEKADSRD